MPRCRPVRCRSPKTCVAVLVALLLVLVWILVWLVGRQLAGGPTVDPRVWGALALVISAFLLSACILAAAVTLIWYFQRPGPDPEDPEVHIYEEPGEVSSTSASTGSTGLEASPSSPIRGPSRGPFLLQTVVTSSGSGSSGDPETSPAPLDEEEHPYGFTHNGDKVD